jgi:hypothetical protein
MPQTQVIGGGLRDPGSPLAVDPSFLAARVALRPLEYAQVGQVLGHYAVAQVSGATASIAAGGILGSLRWADASRFCVLMGIRAGWAVTGAVTLAAVMDLQATIARAFSVDFTTAATAANLATPANTNKMRQSMGGSLMGVNGPRICTTAVQSGQTATVDANPFAATVWVNQPSGNATLTQAVGVAGQMQDVYNWNKLGQHPVVLSANEGVFLQTISAGVVTGTIKYYFEWSWAEVAIF